MQTTIPELMDLREASAATRGKVKIGALRRAIHEGELTAFRTVNSCSARILIDSEELGRWLRTKCAGRNVVSSPSEVSTANKQAADAEAAQRKRKG